MQILWESILCVSFILLINRKNISHEFRGQFGVRTRYELGTEQTSVYTDRLVLEVDIKIYI